MKQLKDKAGTANERHIPTRTCIVCKKKGAKSLFYALTRVKDDKIVINTDLSKSGRSIYVCRDGKCIQNLIKKPGRSWQMRLPPEILQELERINPIIKD